MLKQLKAWATAWKDSLRNGTAEQKRKKGKCTVYIFPFLIDL